MCVCVCVYHIQTKKEKIIQYTDKDCDPLHDKPVHPSRWAPHNRQTQTFLNKQKYGHEFRLGARSQDGLTDWLTDCQQQHDCLPGWGQLTRAGNPAWGLGEGLTAPHLEIPTCYEMLNSASDMGGSFQHGNEPSGSIKREEFFTWVTVGFSRRTLLHEVG
jgi:hypothetical protein